MIKKAYMQGEVEFEDGENGEDGAASPRNVGHNIYILAHQVRSSLWALLDTPSILSCPVTDFLESFLPALVVPMGTWLAGVFGHLPQGVKFQNSAPCSVW